MKYNINENIEKAEKENDFGGKTSNWFKFKEGPNRMRILSYGEPIAEKFKLGVVYGKDRGYPHDDTVQTIVKWLYFIIDRADNKIKLAKLPHTIVKSLGALQQDPDYAFDGFPMPFDITINALNAGTKEVTYSITPARANTEITEQEEAELVKMGTPTDVVNKMKEKAIEQHKKEGIWLSPETLAFQEAKRKESFKKEVAEYNAKVDNGEIKPEVPKYYPKDEINPEDIPF